MHRCCLCPEHQEVVDLHHIVPINEEGPDTEENLMVVCPTCHAKIHRIRNRYNPTQLRMYKGRWAERCAEGAPPPTTADGQPRKIPPHPNPFTPLSGRIDNPDRVFDRDREIARALEFLQAGSSIAIIGPRRIGKSSLLTKLRILAPERLGSRWETAYLDFQNIADGEDFYTALCDTLDIPDCRGYTLARRLAGRRVLLCLDEVEAITWETFSRGVRAQLRGLAEGEESPLKLVLAARTPLDRLFRDSEGLTSPLAGICSQIRIGAWSKEIIHAFVVDRLKGTGVDFSADQVRRLADESSGHPASLVQSAYDLYIRLTGSAQ
jgi:hypothetical protein